MGFIDGIIISLAFYIFFYRVQFEPSVLILYTIFAGIIIAILFAVGAFFTRRNENLSGVNNRILNIYQKLDIDDTIKDEMTNDTIAEQKIWENEWTEGYNSAGKLSPLLYGLIIFFSYLGGSLMIALNSVINKTLNIEWSLLPIILLAISGFLKYKWNGRNPYYGMLIIALTGITVAIGMYFIGGLF